MFLVLMIDSLANGMFIPVSLLYLVRVSGASLLQVGTLLSLAGIVSLPLPLWIGRIVDSRGPKPVVLAAQWVQAAGFLGYLVTSNRPALLIAAIAASSGQRIFWSSIFVLVDNLACSDGDPRARERWFGTIGALRAAGYGVGAFIAGVAVSIGSVSVYWDVIAADAALLLAAALLVRLQIPRIAVSTRTQPKQGLERGYRTLWADRPYLALVALNSAFALCNVMLSIALPPFVAHRLPSTTWVVGPLLAMNTLVQAVLQPLVVRLLRPIPRHSALCLAGILWTAWSLLTMSPLWLPAGFRIPCLTLAVLCYSAAQLIHSPVSNALAADAAPSEVRGRYLAVFQYSFAIATTIAPTMFSVLFDVANAAPWSALGAVALLTVPGMLLIAPHLPQAALTGGCVIQEE
ncbi:MFS transporter [Streptomyces sp. NPDC050508]|uniref:MFS transporter n=1 Tax=Streptomyces sp. NPDC050508 TaxID=3155405 RepID=UPI003442610B